MALHLVLLELGISNGVLVTSQAVKIAGLDSGGSKEFSFRTPYRHSINSDPEKSQCLFKVLSIPLVCKLYSMSWTPHNIALT